MAKSVGNSRKISFGKRKGGKATKFKGPKDKATKPYNRQGRL
jgi:hypothetical protein|tara:strand:+ start:635 stop:760 length:126 start_codon:yes stop_codon:yes gene_type:complete